MISKCSINYPEKGPVSSSRANAAQMAVHSLASLSFSVPSWAAFLFGVIFSVAAFALVALSGGNEAWMTAALWSGLCLVAIIILIVSFP